MVNWKEQKDPLLLKGRGRVTNNVSGAPIDSAVMISDEEAVTMVRGIILVDLFICKVM